jgi:hypothetical protein
MTSAYYAKVILTGVRGLLAPAGALLPPGRADCFHLFCAGRRTHFARQGVIIPARVTESR